MPARRPERRIAAVTASPGTPSARRRRRAASVRRTRDGTPPSDRNHATEPPKERHGGERKEAAAALTATAASTPYEMHMDYMQKICLPIVLTCGRVQIHLLVAVAGLK